MPSAIVPEAALPIFDFSKFREGTQEERIQTADQIVDAFKTYGFVYLVNHGISNDQIGTLFDWVRVEVLLQTCCATSPEDLRPHSRSITAHKDMMLTCRYRARNFSTFQKTSEPAQIFCDQNKRRERPHSSLEDIPRSEGRNCRRMYSMTTA
jgi:hypothetical protein